MRLRHLRYWRCFFFGHILVPILDEELQAMFGSGGYRCSRCPFGSGSKQAFLKYMAELGRDRTITDSAFGVLFDGEKDLLVRVAVDPALKDSKPGTTVVAWVKKLNE